MAEETTVVETQQTQTQVETQATPNPFGKEAWTEQVPTAPNAETQTTPTTTEPAAGSDTKAQTQTAATQTETTIPKEWLKKEFETEDPETIKTQLKEYRELKEKPTAQEIKFENEQSKIIHELIREGKTKEVREFLETQEKLNQFTTADVNEDNAADIIKMGMQLKYKDLSPAEINYKFNKEYGIPKEPIYDENKETEYEFTERKEAWQEKADDIKMSRMIEAKLAKPELEKLKTNLVLPEINKPDTQKNEPTQESLEAIEKARNLFLEVLESNYNKADGFTTQVKDESVEIPVSFKIPDENKVAIKERLKEGFDIDSFFNTRWFDENRVPKIEKIISDIFLLENPDKVLSGIANNSANERLKEERKQKSNITIGQTHQQTFQPQNNNGQAASPFASNAWSEKPPALNN